MSFKKLLIIMLILVAIFYIINVYLWEVIDDDIVIDKGYITSQGGITYE